MHSLLNLFHIFFFAGTDPYHVSTPPTYLPQQPPTQPGNQGPLRTIPPTGPPNQPSTPPNSDIKVQQMPQSTPMSLTVSTLLIIVLQFSFVKNIVVFKNYVYDMRN